MSEWMTWKLHVHMTTVLSISSFNNGDFVYGFDWFHWTVTILVWLGAKNTYSSLYIPYTNWFHAYKSTFPWGSADIGQRRTGQPLGTPT